MRAKNNSQPEIPVWDSWFHKLIPVSLLELLLTQPPTVDIVFFENKITIELQYLFITINL